MIKSKISVIIPVFNEVVRIGKTLGCILPFLDDYLEVIVVDGGSQDATVSLVESLGVRVILSAPGKAKQMNAGARIAGGDILLFLHADTLLPEGFDHLIRETLRGKIDQENSPIAGAFNLKILPPLFGLKLIEIGVNWRSNFWQMPYGDQAIFLNSATFWELGGFPDQPIMEDFELVKRLQKRGKIAIISTPVITSSRRWEKLGIFRTTMINQLIVISYCLGVPIDRISRWY